MTRGEADLALAHDIEMVLPELRRVFSDLKRSGAVVGEDLVTMHHALEMIEAAAARLTLRGNEGQALDCDGGDAIADAERTWPEG